MAGGAALDKLRAICLELPGTQETLTWGHPNFRVGDKIFSSFGDMEDGSGDQSYSFKADKALQAALVSSDPQRFAPSHYVGQHGWTTVRLSGKVDWSEVQMFVLGSYRLIAPKRLVAALDREEAHQAEAKVARAAPKPQVVKAEPKVVEADPKKKAGRVKPKATKKTAASGKAGK